MFDRIRANSDKRFHHDAQFSPSLCRDNAAHARFRILVYVKHLNLNSRQLFVISFY